MLRIRLHGRGGQGIKTASQILGTAGFLQGFQAQDFPLYGAERRGAPIVAFTRFDRKQILERGAIAEPDLILVGDETLLQDPQASPLAGAGGGTLLFINSSHTSAELKKHFLLPFLPTAADLTDLCIRFINKSSVLSSALAAVGARMSGIIELDTLLEAMDRELEELGIGEIPRQNNFALAREVFETLPVPEHPFRPHSLKKPVATPVIELKQEPVADAAPLILAPANMGLRKTGNWRVYRPEIDLEHCNGCWICFVRCPDGAIGINDDCQPVIDYSHCKGCMICERECPLQVIKAVREEASWV